MRDEIKNESGNPALEKSFSFALRIVKLYQHLSEKKKEFVLSKQVLRSGTSIGANLEESRGAQTPSEFSNKNLHRIQRSKRNLILAASSFRFKISYRTTVCLSSRGL